MTATESECYPWNVCEATVVLQVNITTPKLYWLYATIKLLKGVEKLKKLLSWSEKGAIFLGVTSICIAWYIRQQCWHKIYVTDVYAQLLSTAWV